VSDIKMIPVLNQAAHTVVQTKRMIETMPFDINKLHKVLGHCGETYLKARANAYGMKIFGKMKDCNSRAIGEAK
jgi:hypothetical protein